MPTKVYFAYRILVSFVSLFYSTPFGLLFSSLYLFGGLWTSNLNSLCQIFCHYKDTNVCLSGSDFLTGLLIVDIFHCKTL